MVLSTTLRTFLEKAGKEISVFESILKDAYLRGYHDRIAAENKLNKNPIIHIGHRDWYRFNYGASQEEDREMGANASGTSLSWYEANMIPYCKLPSKVDFETLLECTSIDIRYNIGSSHTAWNSRVVLLDNDKLISFYEWGNCYPKSYVKGRHIIQCWLSDEVDKETALTVVFLIKCEKQEKVGNYKGELIGIEYVPVPKVKTMQAHFMNSSHVPEYEDFVEFYLGD